MISYEEYPEAPFLDLHLFILDGFISCKNYHKRDDFDFEKINFAFFDGYVPRPAFYGVLHIATNSVRHSVSSCY